LGGRGGDKEGKEIVEGEPQKGIKRILLFLLSEGAISPQGEERKGRSPNHWEKKKESSSGKAKGIPFNLAANPEKTR